MAGCFRSQRKLILSMRRQPLERASSLIIEANPHRPTKTKTFSPAVSVFANPLPQCAYRRTKTKPSKERSFGSFPCSLTSLLFQRINLCHDHEISSLCLHFSHLSSAQIVFSCFMLSYEQSAIHDGGRMRSVGRVVVEKIIILC